ncbi:hypothetical protein IWW52_000726 [Coemansia sp. RSA 2704]|nr:hypothetical protein IWW54_002768 [Coemansia sp. RSA 2705]KAJ2321467.1 hypothetical protein IWW52_000726 [Coemansia sp. RSA 2704]
MAAADTADKERPADDFIGFEASSSEDEGEIAPAAGAKRSHSDDERETPTAAYQKCYNGQPVPPWLSGLPRLGQGTHPDINTMINEEVTKFVAHISPTPEEHQMRAWVVQRLQRVLDEWQLPRVRPVVRCFGSFDTQLYLPTSDIDVTLMLYETDRDHVSPQYESREQIRPFLYKLARQLKQCGFCVGCEVIPNARVQIIKTTEAVSGIAVDISINADSGMQSARVQRSFSQNVYPGALRALVLAIKQFLYQRSMNEVYTGGMGSYAITLLVVSMLQMHPRIQSGGLDITQNLGVLLVEFFELYGKRFNYDNVCICVRERGCYLDKRRKGFANYSQPYLLAIEDPCDLTNDVTKGTYGINRIKQTFSGAYDLLNNAIFAYHQTRTHGRPINHALDAADDRPAAKRMRGKGGHSSRTQQSSAGNVSSDPWAPVSFLSSILRIDPLAVAKRRKLIDAFHSGAMQRILGVAYQPQLVRALDATLTNNGSDALPATKSAKPIAAADASGGSSAQEQINRMKFDFANQAGGLPTPTEAAGAPDLPVLIADDDEDDEENDAFADEHDAVFIDDDSTEFISDSEYEDY